MAFAVNSAAMERLSLKGWACITYDRCQSASQPSDLLRISFVVLRTEIQMPLILVMVAYNFSTFHINLVKLILSSLAYSNTLCNCYASVSKK